MTAAPPLPHEPVRASAWIGSSLFAVPLPRIAAQRSAPPPHASTVRTSRCSRQARRARAFAERSPHSSASDRCTRPTSLSPHALSRSAPKPATRVRPMPAMHAAPSLPAPSFRCAPDDRVLSASCATQCRVVPALRAFPRLGLDPLHACHKSLSTAEPLWFSHLSAPMVQNQNCGDTSTLSYSEERCSATNRDTGALDRANAIEIRS